MGPLSLIQISQTQETWQTSAAWEGGPACLDEVKVWGDKKR